MEGFRRLGWWLYFVLRGFEGFIRLEERFSRFALVLNVRGFGAYWFRR